MSIFTFKHFSVSQSTTTMKVGTDAMLLGSFVTWRLEPASILDIGTGTGVLALMLAQRTHTSCITGIEIDELAASEAIFNFKNSAWSMRLAGIHGDILFTEFDQPFDLIISNPPYYENSLLSENERTARAKHAEFLPVTAILEKVEALLSEIGTFWVIIPSENAASWLHLAAHLGLHLHESIAIIGKEGQAEKRRILAFGRNRVNLQTGSLAVRDQYGNYTQEYIEITKEFHDRDLSH